MTVIGARPQFIKAAPVSKALLDNGVEEYLLHTGQHYDHGMSEIFFEELQLPEPDINLAIGSGSHGQQTGRMLEAIEQQLQAVQPDTLLVYGDTNSTLAGALAATKLHVPVAHIEAGLRSYNRKMPEEHNRVLTDHCSTHLFCPTQTAVNNLQKEGITENVHQVGDPMLDAVLHFLPIAKKVSTVLEDHGLTPGQYYLATIHRPSNVDEPSTLAPLIETLGNLPNPVLLPIHPRTQAKLNALPHSNHASLRITRPAGYLDMLQLIDNATAILTDSGGLQKEALFLQTPCITLREETEWTETLEDNANQLTGTDPAAIRRALDSIPERRTWPESAYFGDGTASTRTAQILAA